MMPFDDDLIFGHKIVQKKYLHAVVSCNIIQDPEILSAITQLILHPFTVPSKEMSVCTAAYLSPYVVFKFGVETKY